MKSTSCKSCRLSLWLWLSKSSASQKWCRCLQTRLCLSRWTATTPWWTTSNSLPPRCSTVQSIHSSQLSSKTTLRCLLISTRRTALQARTSNSPLGSKEMKAFRPMQSSTRHTTSSKARSCAADRKWPTSPSWELATWWRLGWSPTLRIASSSSVSSTRCRVLLTVKVLILKKNGLCYQPMARCPNAP